MPNSNQQDRMILRMIESLIDEEPEKVRALMGRLVPGGVGQLQPVRGRIMQVAEMLIEQAKIPLPPETFQNVDLDNFEELGGEWEKAVQSRKELRGQLHKQIIAPVTSAKRTVEGHLGELDDIQRATPGRPTSSLAKHLRRDILTPALQTLSQEEARRVTTGRRAVKLLRNLAKMRGGGGPLIMLALAAGILPALMRQEEGSGGDE